MDVQVAADVAELEQVGRRRRRVELAQLRRRQGERVGARASGGRAATLRRADRADELASQRLRRRADHLDRIAVRSDADDTPLVPLEHGDELRQRLGVGEPLERDDDSEARRELAGAARIAGGLAAERVGHLADERERAVQGHPAPRPRRAELRQPLLDPRGRLRPDPRRGREPVLRRGLPQLRQRRDPERVPELAHPLRRDAEQRGDADELRERLRLQLVQLCDAPGLDQLAQPRLDPGADAGQLARTPGSHERGHVGGRRADQVGRATVGAHGVVAEPLRSSRAAKASSRSASAALVTTRVWPMTQIVIPFRGEHGKQRLDAPDEVRARLGLAMLGDVLAAATAMGRTLVVTDDEDGRALAAELGADPVADVRRRPGRRGRRGPGAARRRAGARRQCRPAVRRPARPAHARRRGRARRDRLRRGRGRDDERARPPRQGAFRAALRRRQRGALPRPRRQRTASRRSRCAIPNLADDVDTLDDLRRIGLRAGPRTQAAIGRALQP